MKSLFKHIQQIAFPPICACCGHYLDTSEKHLCSFCRMDRFETAGISENGVEKTILPESVHFRVALWCFDKGGYLQDLMHKLKYERLYGLGFDMGIELGKMLSETALEEEYPDLNPLLIPVPLHRKKFRQRGYNQARAIAEGISGRLNWDLIEANKIKRIKHTRTQTGLTSEERQRNISGAFRLETDELIEAVIPVIVDDVFTTGATTFELAGVLEQSGFNSAVIATVAEA